MRERDSCCVSGALSRSLFCAVELDAALAAHSETLWTHTLRREPLGDDRAFSRHWRLACDGGRRVVVRLSRKDERFSDEFAAWGVFETPQAVEQLSSSLNARGVREGRLSDRLESSVRYRLWHSDF